MSNLNKLFRLFIFSDLRQLCNASGQKCYSPDGNIIALSRPCLPKIDVSPCCRLGWDGNAWLKGTAMMLNSLLDLG